MRRTILWLNENGVAALLLVLLFAVASTMIGGLASLVLYPDNLDWHGFKRSIIVGDGFVVVVGGLGTAATLGWKAAVAWAKSPPAIKPNIVTTYAKTLHPSVPKWMAIGALVPPPHDEFMEAAKREVEQIAPDTAVEET